MRLLGLLLLVLIALGVVGYFRGWIEFSSETYGGETEYGVKVHKEEITEDLSKASSKVGQLLEKIGKGKVSGTVESVDARSGELVVRTEEGETLTFELPDQVEFQLDGSAAALGRLKAGDEVTLVVDDAAVKSVVAKRK